jgi:CubicO group peptidase (beta-lactamase class C family)
VLSCSESGEDPEPTELERDVDDRIEEAVAEGFSGSILVVVDGQRLAASGHGLANRADNTVNTENTAFDVGSILKDFTATAIFALQEADKLSISDPLSKFFPDVPAEKSEITLLQLLQHTAGFDEYHDTSGDFEPMTRAEARERIFAQDLLFEPGSDEAYSNSGFTLLADVVETASGESFTEYVRHAIFEPAGMERSGFYSESLWQTVDTAVGYEAETFDDNDPATWPYTWALIGNGGLVSTVVDLEKWFAALENEQVLGVVALEEMREQYLSLGAATVSGELVYSYAGAGDFGLGGVAVDVPGKDTRVIVASNAYEAYDVEGLVVDLTYLVLDIPENER